MEVNIVGPCTTQTSYGLVVLNLCKALDDLGNKVSLFPLGQVEQHSYFNIKEWVENSFLFNKEAPCVRIFHQHSLDLFCGKLHIGFPIFELDRFTPRQRHHLQSCDVLLSCSKWAQEVVPRKSSLVPLGVDLELFSPLPNFNEKPAFLHIGKTEVRKRSYEIVDCFAQEFKDDDVELWLAWSNIFTGNEDWDRYAKQKLGDKVKFVPRMDYVDLPKLINKADALISMSSAEGWNLPILEGMACEKWVIATDCTGQTEFLDDSCHKIEVDELEWAQDGQWFNREGKWYKVGEKQKTQFKEHLRDIYNKIKAGSVNSAARERAKEFSWENSAKKLITSINSIQ
jgi:glycosyltransferase involved in cell wall biosynthesis